MIQLLIVMTGKGYSKKEKFSCFKKETKSFSDMKEAKKYLKEHYGKCKRVPMFIDGKDNVPKKIGYVFGFHNADFSHYPVHKWIQQDWIEFQEIKTMELN